MNIVRLALAAAPVLFVVACVDTVAGDDHASESEHLQALRDTAEPPTPPNGGIKTGPTSPPHVSVAPQPSDAAPDEESPDRAAVLSASTDEGRDPPEDHTEQPAPRDDSAPPDPSSSTERAAHTFSERPIAPKLAPGQAEVAPSIVNGQKFILVAKHSGKCLDVTGGPGATGNGVLIQQWSCLPGQPTNQQWQFTNPVVDPNTGFTYWQIKAVNSRKCLDVRGASTADGAQIQQWECGTNFQLNQRWLVVGGFPNVSSIFGELVSAQSGKCLDVTGGESAIGDGVKIQQWSCLLHGDGTPVGNQLWGRGTF